MRVLLVNDLPPGPTGGAEVHVGRLVDALSAAGCEVATAFAQGGHTGWRRALDLWDPGARRMVRERIASFAPDVVHVHNVLNELSTSVVGLGAPTVLTVHDPRLLGTRFGADQDRSLLVPRVALRAAKDRFARERLRRVVEATVAPSRSLADALRAAGFPAVHHVENFAPTGVPTPLGDEIAYVGAVRSHKGPQVLLEAWTAIAHQHPDVSLRFVGDGPLRPVLAERARAAGLGDRVVLDGAVEPVAVPALLERARLVVVPSLGVEGGGPTLAVIEAMAAARPVVVTDRPGVSEGVDGTVGAVVPAGDAPALAAAIHDLLSDPGRLDALGRAALERAALRWSPGVAAARLLDVYRSVLA